MTNLLRLCAVLTLLTTFTAAAQWAPQPSSRIPRTADGAPNLEAPAPRTADGKPDLTGVWQGFGTLGGTAAQAEPEGSVPRAGFANVGQNMKDPPYRSVPKLRRWRSSDVPPAARTIPKQLACRWASCSSTRKARRASSFKRPTCS